MLVLIIMLLTSCTSTPNYGQSLQNWVGVSQETLYESWGEPDSVFNVMPNETVVTYVNVDENGPIGGNSQPYAGTEVYYPAIATPDYGFPENQQNTYYCKTSFTIQNSQVVDYTFNGDDCVSN